MIVMYNGKKVGIQEGRKLIKSGKQVVLFRMMDGFGMPRQLVEESLSRKAEDDDPSEPIESVEIHYLGKIYRAPLAEFLRNGKHYYRPPYEPQYILPRRFFSIEDPKQTRLI